MVLTRADIMAAIRIRKLLYHARHPGTTPAEADAFRRKAERLRSCYRYGKAMSVS